MPSAHTVIENPGGSLSLLTGMSFAGVGVGGAATGASGEVANSGGRPCCQAGGGCWAAASGASANVRANTTTSAVGVIPRMVSLPFENRVASGPDALRDKD